MRIFPAYCSAVSVSAGLLAAVFMAARADTPWTTSDVGDAWVVMAERAFDRGDLFAAESLVTAAPASASPHSLHLLKARLAASRGDWRRTDAILREWNMHPERSGSTGEVLFWKGWSALHQGNVPRADSMFVLASAYAGEPRAQDALEYRFAALLENPPALQEYLRGLPESPLPGHLRAASLQRVPAESRLRPYALWHLARIHEQEGDTATSRDLLRELAREPSTVPGRRAAARLGAILEAANPDSARATYEGVLLRQQQGIPAEFSRERLQKLR